MSNAPRPMYDERMEKAKGRYVCLGDHCGRVGQAGGATGALLTRSDDRTLPGRVREAHERFRPLYEQAAEVPAERISADGARVRITAYHYDPERNLIRMKTERTTRASSAYPHAARQGKGPAGGGNRQGPTSRSMRG
jgi:hypothetical protein